MPFYYTALVNVIREFMVDDILVEARVDPDDGRVHLSGYRCGNLVMRSVALRGSCGKFVVSHWRGRDNTVLPDASLREKTQRVIDSLYNT